MKQYYDTVNLIQSSQIVPVNVSYMQKYFFVYYKWLKIFSVCIYVYISKSIDLFKPYTHTHTHTYIWLFELPNLSGKENY